MHHDIPEFTRNLARAAGALIRAEQAALEGLTTSFKGGTELVTNADIKADQFICDAIRARFPEHRILAEESAPELLVAGYDAPLWIIDPIDGTVNFAHDHDQSAVSIAYAENGRIECGVVFNPFVDEMFHATRGQGAWLNERRIQVAQKESLRRALVATGFPYIKSREILAPIVKRLALVLEECGDIRRLGSAALDICWVAMGRLDGYYESLSVWDFAAAQLIAKEAGAQYGHFKPVPAGVSEVFHNEHILVANPTLYPQLLDLLQRAESAR